MAVTLKRKRGAVSYKEPSSDEDISDDSGNDQTPRSKRLLPTRRSTRRSDALKESDDEGSVRLSSPEVLPSHKPSRASRPSRNSRSHGKRRISYKDMSSDEDEEDPDADFEPAAGPVQATPSKARQTGAQPARTRANGSSRGRPRRMLILGAAKKPNTRVPIEHKALEVPSDGHIPDWASLPFHVLLQIFVYASHPLHDENMKPTTSIAWLTQIARMCLAFTKPALTALYRNPPIFATRQTRKDLVHHLITPPPGAHEDYRVMVKRLELDATQMTGLTDSAHSVEDLAAVVRSLTTLREIDIFDPIDRPPFRGRLRRIRRWVYPRELFDAIRQTELRLRSWRWNSTFCDHDPLWIKTVHGDTPFQSLRDLTLTKFHPEAIKEDVVNEEGEQGRPIAEELLASALTVLPHLRSLTFETCGIVSGRLLPLLPDNLVSLNIINCGELLSDALQAFLATHGTQLEELVLHHNQALDLSFLVDLKRSCPRLEVLRMDATYYSSLEMSSDNEPLYETLLGESEVPTWPSTLRIIDMEYLRNWNSTSATNFFTSLIDAAGDLPWLRELTIVAMVDTDWRQRAEFRMKWSDRFRKVFARKWVEPSPYLVSLKAFREWSEQSRGESRDQLSIGHKSEDTTNQPEKAKSPEESDSDAPLLPVRQQKKDEKWDSKRLRARSKTTGSYDEATDKESQSEDETESDRDDEYLVQGLCHTVIFRIDNFRPREEIYGEADFLDAEPSGDEEWNGNEEQEEGGYAW